MNSFKYAFRGIYDTIKTERNMRVHLCFTFYVIIAGFVTNLSGPEWAAILICIGVVNALECLNTALESLCDTVHPENSEGIRNAKDASAGAVLYAAIASIFVGGAIFFNTEKFGMARNYFINDTFLAILTVLTLIPLCFFVKGRKRDNK
jgi:diacylglycerol kinase (ATP)